MGVSGGTDHLRDWLSSLRTGALLRGADCWTKHRGTGSRCDRGRDVHHHRLCHSSPQTTDLYEPVGGHLRGGERRGAVVSIIRGPADLIRGLHRPYGRLGGVFTDHVSWRWCFYINIPLGAVSAVVIIYLLPLNRPPAGNLTPSQKLQSMDLLGTVFLVPGVVTLLLALQWGGSQYPWSNWRVILLFVVCAALLAIFVGLQCCYTEHATLPPRIVGNRNMLGAIWYMVCIPGACFVFLYYVGPTFDPLSTSFAPV